MLRINEVRHRTAVVVPVYFNPDVRRETIQDILEGTFSDQNHFCRKNWLVAVIDQGTTAESVFRNATKNSPLYGVPVVLLEKNRAKAGGVTKGLEYLLSQTGAEFFITRDCDGDHVVEDIPRLASAADELAEKSNSELVSIIGSRPSLEKPMGWVREEWEILTNRVLVDLLKFLMAKQGKIIDQRFWVGDVPDIQSGYRLYNRAAAELAVECLNRLPEDRTILSLACEFVTFAEIVAADGIFGQVQRLTLVEQPVSSFSNLDFANDYGSLLVFLADYFQTERKTLLKIFDNHLPCSSLFFSDQKQNLLRCRRFFQETDSLPELPSFL